MSNFACWRSAEENTEFAIFEVDPDPRVIKPHLVDPEFSHFYVDDRFEFEGIIPPELLSLVEARYLGDAVKRYEAMGMYEHPFEFHRPLLHLEEPPRRDGVTIPLSLKGGSRSHNQYGGRRPARRKSISLLPVYLCAVSAYVCGLASDLREIAEMAKLSNSPLDKRHRPASLLVSRFGFLEFRLQLFDGGEIPPQVRRQACGQAILRHANGLGGIVKRVFSYDHVL